MRRNPDAPAMKVDQRAIHIRKSTRQKRVNRVQIIGGQIAAHCKSLVWNSPQEDSALCRKNGTSFFERSEGQLGQGDE